MTVERIDAERTERRALRGVKTTSGESEASELTERNNNLFDFFREANDIT